MQRIARPAHARGAHTIHAPFRFESPPLCLRDGVGDPRLGEPRQPELAGVTPSAGEGPFSRRLHRVVAGVSQPEVDPEPCRAADDARLGELHQRGVHLEALTFLRARRRGEGRQGLEGGEELDPRRSGQRRWAMSMLVDLRIDGSYVVVL